MDEAFLYQVYDIVSQIPLGYVTSYSVIAEMIGYPKRARMVGKALKHADLYGSFPCHRVIHHDGSLVNGWDEQRQLLEDENVHFKKNNKVDMRKYLWRGSY